MAKYACPSCGVELLYEQLNIKEAVALCQSCGELSKLSDVMDQAAAEQDLRELPSGCTFSDNGRELHIQASLRSVGNAFMYFGFGAFWNGITAVFVVLAISATLQHTIGYVPKYLPAPEMDGGEMSVGMTSFLWLFLTPFILVGMGLVFAFFMAMFGRVDIRIKDDIATVRTGLPLIGWTRKFDPTKVTKVSIEQSWWLENNSTRPLVRIDAGDVLKFGFIVPEERVSWLRSVLKVVLMTPNSAKYDELLQQSQSRLRY